MTELYEELIQRSGLDRNTISIGKEDLDFDDIISALSAIHRGKEVLYGNYIKTHGNDDSNLAIFEHFVDIKRKFIRAQGTMKAISIGKDVEVTELFDTYADLAVYAVMGIQLIDHISRRDQNARRTDRNDNGKSTGERLGTSIDN